MKLLLTRLTLVLFMENNRVYPTRPVVGVGAVVIHDNRILLVKRGREPCRGCWSVPGGVQKVGESLEEAVLRELREETGIDGVVKGVLWVDEVIVYDKERKPMYHYVIIDFLVEPRTTDAVPGSDVVEAKWFPLDTDWNKIRLTETMTRLLKRLREGRYTYIPYTRPANALL